MEDKELRDAIAGRIREARENRGLGQSELADLCGWRPQIQNRYEQGGAIPSGDRIVALARHLGVTAEWLIDGVVHDGGALEKFCQDHEVSKEERIALARVDSTTAATAGYQTLLTGLRAGFNSDD